MISDQEFKEKLKAKFDELKERTLSNLLNQDKEYLNSCKIQHLAETNYLSLKLSEDQKEIIDKLLMSTDASNMEYSTLSYLAGIYDSPKYFNAFDFNENEESEKSTLIKDYYLGNFFPVNMILNPLAPVTFGKKLLKRKPNSNYFSLKINYSLLMIYTKNRWMA